MLDRINHHGKNQCNLELTRHLWLHLICVLIVGELAGTLNKEVVMVHCGDLELWVKNSINIDLCRLKYFYIILVKKCSAITIANLSNRK